MTLPSLAPAAAPPTLLCVDDEPNILAALRRLFRPKGYRVLCVESGAAGLALLGTETVDMVISDMRMPVMDGAQFLAQVRQRHPDTIRILLTGYADVQSILEAINCGEIYRYISKPWDDNDMLLLVRDGLERQALEREKRRLEALTLQQNEALKTLNLGLEAKVEARTAQLRISHDEVLAAHDRLKRNFVTTIKVFSSMVEMRGKLAGRSRRVADLARKIALQMALPAQEVQEIFIAALLLDIGKIGFSDDLLDMPLSNMSGDNLGLFRKHPVRAQQLLMALEDLQGAAAMLRAQMERFDGTGFPDGLVGFGIPLGARILALASDYDNLLIGAMVQRQLRPDEAKPLIYDSSGKRYDPSVVAAFRQLLDGTTAEEAGGDMALLTGELIPGMVLSRDLISRDGLMLLAAEHVMDARLIQQVQDFENKSGSRLALRVYQPRPA